MWKRERDASERTAHLHELRLERHREAAVESGGGARERVHVLQRGGAGAAVGRREQRVPALVVERQCAHQCVELLAQTHFVLLDLLQLVVAAVHRLHEYAYGSHTTRMADFIQDRIEQTLRHIGLYTYKDLLYKY